MNTRKDLHIDEELPRTASALSFLGAGCYSLWGLLHIFAAHGIYQLGAEQSGLVQGRLYQDAALMLAIALAVLYVAAFKNWRNDRFGFWCNLVLVSIADIIFLLFIVWPGHVPPERALPGPTLWLFGALFTWIDYVRANNIDIDTGGEAELTVETHS